MAIARYPGLVIDCPDAAVLGQFYGSLLDWEVSSSEGWCEIRPADGSNCICFQQVEGYVAPAWPAQSVPQQMHLDVIVDDLDEAGAAVVELGATKAQYQPGDDVPRLLGPCGPPVLPLHELTATRADELVGSSTAAWPA